MSDDLDEMLRAYLLHEREDPIRRRLEKLTDWQVAHEAKHLEQDGRLIRMLDGMSFRVTTLEQKADKLADDVEDTKTHDVKALRRKSDRIDSTVFRAVAVVVLVLLGAGTYAAIRDIAGGGTVQLPLSK